jgi:endonuclease/exonuclease/phosphatase family metal-dependent hydrolase
MTLRFVTLNIWHDRGPWPQRLPLIRQELERLRPDVVGLQEVLRFGDTCQATAIADGSGYFVAYGPASGAQGNALLSRHPIRSSRVLPLPGDARSLLQVSLSTPYGELPVFVTHLTWEFERGADRIAQVREIVRHVPDGGVLLGDLNAAPDADEMRFLRGLATVEGQSVYFADAWIYAGDGTPGYTFSRENDYARAEREPSRRIDYIMVRGGPDEHGRGEPVRASVAFATRSDDGVWPSDHFGVVADISFGP